MATVWLYCLIIRCSPQFPTMWSQWQVRATPRELTSPLCNSAPDKPLRKWRFKYNVHYATHWPRWRDWRLWKHTAHGSEVLLRSRLPGNCCYATIESSISVLLIEAQLHHNVPGKCMIMLPLCLPHIHAGKTKQSHKQTRTMISYPIYWSLPCKRFSMYSTGWWMENPLCHLWP